MGFFLPNPHHTAKKLFQLENEANAKPELHRLKQKSRRASGGVGESLCILSSLYQSNCVGKVSTNNFRLYLSSRTIRFFFFFNLIILTNPCRVMLKVPSLCSFRKSSDCWQLNQMLFYQIMNLFYKENSRSLTVISTLYINRHSQYKPMICSVVPRPALSSLERFIDPLVCWRLNQIRTLWNGPRSSFSFFFFFCYVIWEM